MDFYFKVHRSGSDVLVAACDRELLGKTLSGDFDILVNPTFYGQDLCEEDGLFDAISEANLVNLLGNRIVDLAVEKGLVNKKNILIMGGVKHAQIITL
jgi:uncharacterized protein